MRREFRFAKNIELRQVPDKPPVIRGYAARFNSPSLPIGDMFHGLFTERIMPGAFSKSIQKDDVRALVNHDANQLLGRTKSGTLTLREDSDGLYYEIHPPDTSAARDVIESIKRGDMDGSSFGFSVPEGGDNWVKGEDGKQLREVREVKLYDISPVTYPAYPSTSVAMRSLFPDGMPEPVNTVLSMIRDAMAKLATAHKALGGTDDVLTVSGDLTNDNGGDDTTQQPSRSKYSYQWMSPRMQRFYRQFEAEREFDALLAKADPNTNFGRLLAADREIALIEQDFAIMDNRDERDELRRRWESKDPYIAAPPWRSLELYPRKKKEKKPFRKDPWTQ
jgi:uncharacterized protein